MAIRPVEFTTAGTLHEADMEGKKIRLESRGADLYRITIGGIYIDTVEGFGNAKRRATKAVKNGEYLK